MITPAARKASANTTARKINNNHDDSNYQHNSRIKTPLDALCPSVLRAQSAENMHKATIFQVFV